MDSRLLRASLPAIFVATLGLQAAHADIYTWVDASGTMNVSNVAPPDGVRVASVTHSSAPAIAARAEAVREAAQQVEVQALAARVRQLEDEADLGRRQAPPQVEYRTVAPPPVIQYVVMPPSPQYAANPAPPPYTGCDSAYVECGLWGFPGFYPTSVVVLRAPNFRRFHHDAGSHQFAAQPPMRGPRNPRRG